MEEYAQVSNAAAKLLTKHYSSSFGSASKFFGHDIRQDIYNIYGFVRIADEVVDSYKGKDKLKILDQLEAEAYQAILLGYSSNPIIHAFSLTARKYSISQDLIEPFMASMRTDITKDRHSQKSYDQYIYGSAEVVGLMCLRVFVSGDNQKYSQLKDGAAALGSAFQKVNFLRDFAEDYKQLGRIYFPKTELKDFNDTKVKEVARNINRDFELAATAINGLPKNSRQPVAIAFVYFLELLKKIEATSANEIRAKRVRLPKYQKIWLIIKASLLCLNPSYNWKSLL